MIERLWLTTCRTQKATGGLGICFCTESCFSREMVLHCRQEIAMLGNDSATSNWRSIHASSKIQLHFRPQSRFLVSSFQEAQQMAFSRAYYSPSLSATISLTLHFDVIVLSRNKRLIAFGFVSWQQQLDGDARVWSPEWAIFQFLAKVSGDKKRTKRKKKERKKNWNHPANMWQIGCILN